VAMLALGGALKRRERLTARLADVLSELYLASSVLRRYEDDGRPAEDLPLVHWALQDALVRMQDAFYGLFHNLPGRLMASMLRFVVFPWGRSYAAPSDRLGHAVAGLVMAPGAARERLTSGVFVSTTEGDPVGDLERAFAAAIAAEPVEQKLRAVRRARGLTRLERRDEVAASLEEGLISEAEARLVERARALRRKAITVDEFPKDLQGRGG
jgi:acyl-CoA dehydrogenase